MDKLILNKEMLENQNINHECTACKNAVRYNLNNEYSIIPESDFPTVHPDENNEIHWYIQEPTIDIDINLFNVVMDEVHNEIQISLEKAGTQIKLRKTDDIEIAKKNGWAFCWKNNGDSRLPYIFETNTLGYALPSPILYMNEAFNWTIDLIKSTSIHEAFHKLRQGHNSNPLSIMYWSLGDGVQSVLPSDIEGLRIVYKDYIDEVVNNEPTELEQCLEKLETAKTEYQLLLNENAELAETAIQANSTIAMLQERYDRGKEVLRMAGLEIDKLKAALQLFVNSGNFIDKGELKEVAEKLNITPTGTKSNIRKDILEQTGQTDEEI